MLGSKVAYSVKIDVDHIQFRVTETMGSLLYS
jgi:hypothetical protein